MDPVLPVKATTESTAVADGGVVPNRVQRAVTREIVGAVERLNELDYAGQGREITFSIDRTTRIPVVKVVNTDTKEVVEQWPAEYVLRLAADYAAKVRE